MLVNGHYVRYPLVGRDLLTQMGFGSGVHGLSSLLWSRLRRGMHPVDDSASFRDWGAREFGRYWYELFFDGYVRKTWLADPDDLPSDWANQRIKPIHWRLRSKSGSRGQDVFRYPGSDPASSGRPRRGAGRPRGRSLPRFSGRQGSVRRQRLDPGTAERRECVRRCRLFEHAPTVAGGRPGASAAKKHSRGGSSAQTPALITVAVALRKHYDIPYNWVYTPGKTLRVGRDSELRPLVERTHSRAVGRNVPGVRILHRSRRRTVGHERRGP